MTIYSRDLALVQDRAFRKAVETQRFARQVDATGEAVRGRIASCDIECIRTRVGRDGGRLRELVQQRDGEAAGTRADV